MKFVSKTNDSSRKKKITEPFEIGVVIIRAFEMVTYDGLLKTRFLPIS